jgi:tetratricopeptide (TPR) repeat protein
MTMRPIFFILIAATAALFLGSCGAKETSEQGQNQSVSSIYIDSLTREIRKSPDNAALYAKRGEAFYQLESYDAAIKDLQKALELDAEQPEYYRILANVYLDYYQSKQALETLEAAVERFPTDIGLLLKLSEFQMLVKQHGASIQTATSVLELSPMNPDAFFMMGVNYKQLGDTVRAVNSFQTAVEQDPNLLDGFYELGLLLSKQGKNALALQYFDNALAIDSLNLSVLYAKGMHFMNAKQDNEALAIFDKINVIAPLSADEFFNRADPYFNIGIIYLEYDSLKKARDNFNIAVGIDQTMAKAYFYKALASEKMGDKKAALRDYKNARNFDTENVFSTRIEQKIAALNKN